MKRQLRCQQKQIDALPRGFPPQRSGHSGLRATRAAFRIQSPKAVEGDIASGDKFFSDRADPADLLIHLPTIAAVDMESAAVAQVCHEYSVPFTVVRTISDAADESAAHEFPRFLMQVASAYSHGILKRLFDDPARRSASRALGAVR